MQKKTILLYGRTNSGKTAQIGAFSEYVYQVTGGKISRLYTCDRGGTTTIQPHVDLGLVEVVEMGNTDPWIFLNKAVRGFVRDASGKWVPGKNENVGMFAFEGLRSFAESLKEWMANKSSEGTNIGGGSNISFKTTGDGETLSIGGNNPSHYGVAQDRMTSEIWKSQKLDAPFILWTSSVSKDDDLVSAGKVLGPDVIGKALTAEVPRWFSYTFRIDVLPAQQGKAERHILYLGSHVDISAGNATGVGNIRRPIDAAPLSKLTIEPANLAEAMRILDEGAVDAKEVLRKRLGMK